MVSRVESGHEYKTLILSYTALTVCSVVCEASTVRKISDCQPRGPGFNSRPGRGLNFGRPSFATPSMDRGVKPLV